VTIEDLIKGAKYVLLAVGITGGVKWEFQQLDVNGLREKVILLTVPEDERIVPQTWRSFVGSSAKLLDQPNEVLAKSLAARFTSEGSLKLISASRRSGAAYQVALSVCWLPLDQFLELASIRDTSSPMLAVPSD
jgi:intein/homing endonuclease